EWRLSGAQDDLRVQARELVDLGVEVIAVSNVIAARAAREATDTTPIVNAGTVGGDLIEAGLAVSLARPGGNVPGLTTYEPDIIGKGLQWLTEVTPGASRIAVLWASGSPPPRAPYERAAQQLGVELEPVELQTVEDLDSAFDRMTRAGVGALDVRSAPLLNEN